MGIIGYGGYIPAGRISVAEIAAKQGKAADQVMASLGVRQKAVAAADEDTVSLAVEAAAAALTQAKIKPDQIGAILVGSESHPYAVKPTGSIVGEILGVGNEYLTVGLEFGCRAGISAYYFIVSHLIVGFHI